MAGAVYRRAHGGRSTRLVVSAECTPYPLTILGKSDFVVTSDSVDFTNSYPPLDVQDPECKVSELFAPFLTSIKLVRGSNYSLKVLGKKGNDWASDPSFIAQNSGYARWSDNLPKELVVHYPEDGSKPQVVSHYAANMHAHIELGTLMHHRPQLQAYRTSDEETWEKVMMTCSAAAKRLCRVQEAIYSPPNEQAIPGLTGFLAMQRGVNFVIYSVITSIMIHMVCLEQMPLPRRANLDRLRQRTTRKASQLRQTIISLDT